MWSPASLLCLQLLWRLPSSENVGGDATVCLQWARSISEIPLLEKDDPIYEWRERMFQIFDKTISNTHGYTV